MNPEEYQKIKEAEKEHLRALGKLKKAVRDLERSRSIANAVTRMGASSDSALDTHQELVDKLAMETAHYEARLEIAMESAGEKEAQAQKAEDLAKFDAELQKERARSLVSRIRDEMSTDAPSEAPGARPTEGVGQDAARRSSGPETEGALPEKTIGRMRKSESGSRKTGDSREQQ